MKILHNIESTPFTEPELLLQIRGEEQVNALYAILHRALNCWAEAPKEYHDLHTQLANAPVPPKLLPFNPPSTPKSRVDEL